ncbi:hypothetical protein LBGG_01250 [Lactobacillus gasseri MV-22]|nr:hypothetical protein LBGG_01250 [Lactobacillus gasseri MV-22]
MKTSRAASTFKTKIEREDFKLRQSKYYENRQARKARSRRLIQKGALLEKYFQADNLSVEQTEELLKYLLITLTPINRTNSKTINLITRPIVLFSGLFLGLISGLCLAKSFNCFEFFV